MTDRDLTPAEARSRFLQARKAENRPTTIRSYDNRLTEFVAWCRKRDLDSMRDLDGWLLDEYRRHLDQTGNAPATIKGKIVALMQLLDYCERIGVVGEEVADALECPAVAKPDQTSDAKLDAVDAKSLLQYFRNATGRYGTAQHVTLELLWHVGCRTSCLRALDHGDWRPGDRTLAFRDRPPTRLKDGHDHERNVVVSEPVADALAHYLARERWDKRDDEGRRPLLTTTHGRPVSATIQTWCYQASQPCLYTQCPHNRSRGRCEYTERNHASKCPSSRSPHAVRTGSITWQLNQGLDYVALAKRVAAAPETIRRYYDKPDLDEELARRRDQTAGLDIDSEEDD